MKLKYYLRGLGTGIAVTALILGISAGVSAKDTMTDEEILARAKQLGLVERTVLSDMVKDTETSETEEKKTEEVKIEEADVEETVAEEPKAEEPKAEEALEEKTETEVVKDDTLADSEEKELPAVMDDSKNDTTNPDGDIKKTEEFGMPDEAGTISITIERGDSSDSVSRLLEEVGLVDSATAYDKYLCQNGYDKSIRTGNYEIPADATGEEIAKLITGR